jgi:hypothetical protein
MNRGKIDFFISYTSADEEWAEWIGWILDEAGFSVRLQAWDFAAGSNFVLEMQRATEEASRTIAVLSPAYLKSTFAAPEWAATFAKDPEGFQRALVPVRVKECEARGLLKAIVHINLVGLEENEARQRLLDRLSGQRAKPSKKPKFPGGKQSTRTKEHPPFPGPSGSAGAAKTPARYTPRIRSSPTDLEKRRFIQTAFDAAVQHFESGLSDLSEQETAVDCEFKKVTAKKCVAEIFVNGERRARCKFWIADGLGGNGIAYSETDVGWESDNSYNEILSLTNDELALKPLMGGFSGRAEEGLNVEHLTSEEAAEFLWRRFTSGLD